jgi:hypothetical protein
MLGKPRLNHVTKGVVLFPTEEAQSTSSFFALGNLPGRVNLDFPIPHTLSVDEAKKRFVPIRSSIYLERSQPSVDFLRPYL